MQTKRNKTTVMSTLKEKKPHMSFTRPQQHVLTYAPMHAALLFIFP
jgi:hypothetical protein